MIRLSRNPTTESPAQSISTPSRANVWKIVNRPSATDNSAQTTPVPVINCSGADVNDAIEESAIRTSFFGENLDLPALRCATSKRTVSVR